MTTNPPPGRERPDQLTEEAALWFARMRGPEAEAHRPQFEAWLTRGALHRGAYNRAAEIFSMGKMLEADHLDTVASQAPEFLATEAPAKGRRVAAFAAVAATAMLAGWLISTSADLPGLTNPGPDTSASTSRPVAYAAMVLETPAGESRVERLIDGSAVTLGPASRLEVKFGDGKRDLSLIRGRARFEVAHEARPFTVAAAGTLVTARGTVFDVAISPQRGVTVNLLQGSVDVVSAGGGSKTARRLTPGQSLIVPASAVGSATDTAMSLEQPGAMASQPGSATLREFEGARLADIVAQANRLGRIPIRFSDPAIGEIRVSGRFQISDTDKLAERSAAVFDLKVNRSDPSRIVLEPR
ncbi:FecR domain-containing protein [Sphingomonas sp. MG17]|uniref:FecR domain-containing protein n=1 Tax=Sphingomonas tagetis TaxID=2949092 RepID=A0A9X2HMS7_9SPHN|nr:FecR domain-containing protein [Sphingomonas tagetis]MCP3731316.1 FecR domain-containing protein [Sphingomonas tagetis]